MDGWPDAADRQLACSIFGIDDRSGVERMILDWIALQGLGNGTIKSIEISVGAAITVALADGSPILVKAWPGSIERASLTAQLAVQRSMATRGYPAPALLTELSSLGPSWVVAMAYKADGVPTDVRIIGVRRNMAWGLARFIAEADDCRDMPHLPRRQLPIGESIWPMPHNVLLDFDATRRGAEWIDKIARQVLITMRNASSRMVVGHHDWSAKNMRMGPEGIAVLYDWDAVFVDREAFVLGSAAAHFPVTWELAMPETPTVDEVRAFLRDYERARGSNLTALELAEQLEPRMRAPTKRAASMRSIRAQRIGAAPRAKACRTTVLSASLKPSTAAPWPSPIHAAMKVRTKHLPAHGSSWIVATVGRREHTGAG